MSSVLSLPGPETSTVDAAALVVPQAGGGGATAKPLRAALGPSWCVGGVTFGGREDRFLDDLPATVDELVADTAQAATEMAGRLGRPVVLAGQCSGALVAWRAACDLSADVVEGVVLLSRPAPSTALESVDTDAANDDFAAQVIAMGGVLVEIADMPDVLELLLPALRADFSAVASWDPKADHPRLPLPALLLYSETDPAMTPEACQGWSEVCDELEVAALPGEHLLLQGQPDAVAARLTAWHIASVRKNDV